MPLTPAEVHNVAFKKPPIGKRGYDEEEVDAFLDVVEVELARLIEENNDLRANGSSGASADTQVHPAIDDRSMAELAAARDENGRLHARINELERALSSSGDAAGQQVVGLQQQLAHTEQQLGEARQQLLETQEAAQAAQQAHAAAVAAGAGGLTAEDHHAQAVQMLALAQQTADTHLAQSKAEAERLLGDAQATAHATLTDAQQQSQKHVGEAQARADQLERESNERASQLLSDAEQRSAHDHRAVRAAQGSAGKAGRAASNLRARIPRPAEELPGVAAARSGRQRSRRAGAVRTGRCPDGPA